MNFPLIELEIIKNDFDFLGAQMRMRHVILTEKCELEIFGDLSPYRRCRIPPLPWGNEQYFEKKLATIDKIQAEIYNGYVKRKDVFPGTVEVCRASSNVKLVNSPFKIHLELALDLSG